MSMKLSDLKPAEYNPRKIADKASEGLLYSLTEFGDISGIVFNKRTDRLVSGHQRVNQLKQTYGDLEISGGFVKTSKGDKFSVRIVDWPEAKEKAANLAANSPTISGTFTPELGDMLADIQDTDPVSFEAMGFDSLMDMDFDTEMPDYSDANTEIDVDDFDEIMDLKFTLSEDQFKFVMDSLYQLDNDKSKALLMALNYES